MPSVVSASSIWPQTLSAVSLYAASWWARRRGLHRRGQALGVAGATVMTAAGWLGGHLAYGMGVGVDTTAFEGGPTEWREIAGPGESPSRRASADGIALAVLEDEEGQPRVLADRCTHRGGPLSEGQVADGCVTCPWHGSRFDLVDGHVVRGPATEPAPVYEVRGIGRWHRGAPGRAALAAAEPGLTGLLTCCTFTASARTTGRSAKPKVPFSCAASYSRWPSSNGVRFVARGLFERARSTVRPTRALGRGVRCRTASTARKPTPSLCPRRAPRVQFGVGS